MLYQLQSSFYHHLLWDDIHIQRKQDYGLYESNIPAQKKGNMKNSLVSVSAKDEIEHPLNTCITLLGERWG
jgi:hypothetical protein